MQNSFGANASACFASLSIECFDLGKELARDSRMKVSEAERLELEVFVREYGDDPEEFAAAYRGLRAQTTLLIAFVGAEPCGVMRIMRPGARRLKSLADALNLPYGVDVVSSLTACGKVKESDFLDLLTVAVAQEWRDSGVFDELLRAAARLGREFGARLFVAMVDAQVKESLEARGVPLLAHSGAHPYFGSTATYAVTCYVADLELWLDSTLREVHPSHSSR